MRRAAWILAGFAMVLLGIGALTSTGGILGKPLKPFEKEWSIPAGELRDLRIRSDHKVNIVFKESTDGSQSVYVKGQGTDRKIDAIERTRLAGGELVVDLRNPDRGFMNISFGFHFNRPEEEVVVTLVPDAELDNLDLQTDSGSIRLHKNDTSDAEIQADSGSVYVRLPASFAGSLDLKSGSGKITAPEAKNETRDLVKVRTDSGKIEIEQD